MTVFIDTSAFYAVFDRDDKNHALAKKTWERLLEEDIVLCTSNYVVVETTALLQSRLGFQAVQGFHEDVLPLIHVEPVAGELHKAGVSALLAALRRKLSLVDCVNFEVMRSLGIKTVFAFDPHFAEAGFELIPETA